MSNVKQEDILLGYIGVSGKQGPKGEKGPYYTPNVDEEGNISWTNTGDLPNPPTQNIKGPKGDPGIVTGAVHSFNTRQGDVIPLAGDYTPGMVNSVDVENYISNSEIEALFN